MQLHSNTDRTPINDLIVSCVEPVKRLAWKYASGDRERFEELHSIGLLALCEAAVVVPATSPNPQAYLCRSAGNAMINELKKPRLSVTSLDAPLSSDSDNSYCLLDVLSSSTPLGPTSSKRSQALNAAMCRLRSARQRAVLRRRFGLAGYGFHGEMETAYSLRVSVDAVSHGVRRGLKSLRRDARLCAVVGVEVAQ